MDQHGVSQRSRSPSATGVSAHSSADINQSQAQPSAPNFASGDSSVGLGLGLDSASQQQNLNAFGANAYLSPQQRQQQQQAYSQTNVSDPAVFDPNITFEQTTAPSSDPALSFDTSQSHTSFLNQELGDTDFTLFPSGGQSDQYQSSSLAFDPAMVNVTEMPSTQAHQSPTPPSILSPENHGPGSAHQSPAFNTNHFSPPAVAHSRHASLGPEAALLPSQIDEWTQPQFQGHRRTPSEYSDVSSVGHSPRMISQDSFEDVAGHHSPAQRASDGHLYQDISGGIGAFSLADAAASPRLHGRSPSHSPAISPQILPQQLPGMEQPPQFGLAPGPPKYTGSMYGAMPVSQSNTYANTPFPPHPDMPSMAPPSINIDYAEPNNGKGPVFDPMSKGHHLDADSLTPPDRGRPRSRPRAVTDPFAPGSGLRFPNSSLSPSPGPSMSSASSSRAQSSSPGVSAARRRRSTSAASHNNELAKRLADPEYQSATDIGAGKRVQKHPATFQCSLCPKRFTRAYNLRSHLRTHTDERPFVCTVCGKAFARQHDRKRHESLHSGEKKFVCKGDLKNEGQWGCGRRFARADALGRHFRSEAGRVCIKPLLDEEVLERQQQWQGQQMQQNVQTPGIMVNDGSSYPMDAQGHYALPAAILAQYPSLATLNWSAPEMTAGMDDDVSGRSSFDASDYDDGEDGGYVSGPGTGFGDGSMPQNYGDIGYASDYGR